MKIQIGCSEYPHTLYEFDYEKGQESGIILKLELHCNNKFYHKLITSKQYSAMMNEMFEKIKYSKKEYFKEKEAWIKDFFSEYDDYLKCKNSTIEFEVILPEEPKQLKDGWKIENMPDAKLGMK